MIQIREAPEEDNQALIELQTKCPQGTSFVLNVDSSPDFFARSKPFKDWSVLVAVDDDNIVGSAAYAVNDVLVNDVLVKTAYEYGFMVDPEKRRKGIAVRLQGHIEHCAKKKNVDLLGLTIIEDNVPSMSLFSKMGFERVKDCATFSLMVYKKQKLVNESRVRHAEEGDLADIVGLINEMHSGYSFFHPLRPEDLLDCARRMPGFSLDSIFVFEDSWGINACLGCWDYTKVRKYIVQRFGWQLKAQSLLLRFLGLLTDVPRIPKPGEPMLSYNLTALAFKDSGSMTDLIKHVSNIALENKIGFLNVPVDLESPAVEVLSEFRHAKVGLQFFVKSLSGRKFSHLGESRLYVDVNEI